MQLSEVLHISKTTNELDSQISKVQQFFCNVWKSFCVLAFTSMCLSYLKWSNSNLFFRTISLPGVFTNRDLWQRDMATKQAVISSLQLHQQFVPKWLSDHIGRNNSQCSSSYTWHEAEVSGTGPGPYSGISTLPISVISSFQPQPFAPTAIQMQVTVLVMGDRQGVCLVVTPEKRILQLCGINSSKGDYL